MSRNKIFYSDNGTLVDYTNELHRYRSGIATFSLIAAQDVWFIGSNSPFNHLFFKFQTANTTTTTMTLQYWGGGQFNNVVELMDGTNGFKQDGFVEFTPSRSSSWVRQDTDQGITGLTSKVVYDKYWIKISFNNDMDANVIMSFVGHKFSDDDDIRAEFPDLMRSNVFSAFETGKTSWEEQHVKAADILIEDLISKNVIHSKGQILERETFRNACVSKTAEIIYSTFGDDFIDQSVAARKEYHSRLNKSIYNVDLDGDARLDVGETRSRQGFMSR